MKSSSYTLPVKEALFGQGIPFQATCAKLAMDLKKEMLIANEAPDTIPQRSQKELTKEATYMMYCMLIFVLLAVLGSSVTAYEVFFNDNRKRIKACITCGQEKSKNTLNELEKGSNFFKRDVFLNSCKSFLKCFCMIKNGRKILSTASSEDQIDCIQGLRFISNAWVILLHTGSIYILFLKDVEPVKPFFELKASELLLNGYFSVDIFFVISGFLNSYHSSHHYNIQNGNINWAYFYIKRFVRLMPMYMIALGFYSTLFTYTGTGIIWPTYDTNPVCKRDWWWHLIYINNFKESAQQCMGLYWSIETDMQFYIISPLFLISLIRCPRLGYFLVSVCIAGSCVTSFMLTYLFNLCDGASKIVYHLDDTRDFLIKYFEYFDMVYTKPFTRISSYLVGFSLGYYLYLKNPKKNIIRNSKVTLCCGWITIAGFVWICFSPPRGDILMDTALYNGKKFLLFSCGAAWIIYVCLTGQAECLNRCLSWKVLLPLSRLSYCACLIHPIILFRVLLQAKNVMEFSAISMISLSFYVFIFTYIVSFIASILFETPLINVFNWVRMKTKTNTSRLKESVYERNSQNLSDVHKIS